ncbi:hypothetical protein WA577_004910 [Blastocystis sp. JDR]
MSSALFYSAKSDEELSSVIVSYICSFHTEEDAPKIKETLEDSLNKKKYGEFVIFCCKELSSHYVANTDKDVESVYFLLMEMVKKLGNCDECKDICLQICDILFAASFPTTLKARLLSMILNAMPSFKACRVALLKKTISFAQESKSLEFFYIFLMKQNNDDWENVMTEYRQVLITFRELLLEVKRENEAYNCLIKLLSTYKSNEDDYVKYATECALSLLNRLVFDESLHCQEQVVLQGLTEKAKDLAELLAIVNSGDLKALEALISSTDVLAKYQLNEKVIRDHCRIMALAKLCSAHQQMSYEDIAKALAIPQAEVEACIVAAVKAHLVEGKMNQIKEEFVVTRTHCIVVDGEWKNMLEKVQQWKEHVQFVIDNCDKYMN